MRASEEESSGSCRDFANLFMQAAQHLGLAARFVSGYLHAEPSSANYGSTHAWAEVFLPGAGWKGFDPTIGTIVGPPGASLDVGVWVTALP